MYSGVSLEAQSIGRALYRLRAPRACKRSVNVAGGKRIESGAGITLCRQPAHRDKPGGYRERQERPGYCQNSHAPEHRRGRLFLFCVSALAPQESERGAGERKGEQNDILAGDIKHDCGKKGQGSYAKQPRGQPFIARQYAEPDGADERNAKKDERNEPCKRPKEADAPKRGGERRVAYVEVEIPERRLVDFRGLVRKPGNPEGVGASAKQSPAQRAFPRGTDDIESGLQAGAHLKRRDWKDAGEAGVNGRTVE